MAKKKKTGQFGVPVIIYYVAQVFHYTSIFVFYLLPFVPKKKQQGNAGEFLIGLTEDVATFLHCLFTVIRLLIFPVIFLLTNTKAYTDIGTGSVAPKCRLATQE